jgi:hypothetical protein
LKAEFGKNRLKKFGKLNVTSFGNELIGQITPGRAIKKWLKGCLLRRGNMTFWLPERAEIDR